MFKYIKNTHLKKGIAPLLFFSTLILAGDCNKKPSHSRNKGAQGPPGPVNQTPPPTTTPRRTVGGTTPPVPVNQTPPPTTTPRRTVGGTTPPVPVPPPSSLSRTRVETGKKSGDPIRLSQKHPQITINNTPSSQETILIVASTKGVVQNARTAVREAKENAKNAADELENAADELENAANKANEAATAANEAAKAARNEATAVRNEATAVRNKK
ncbi:MAG: hypothetical protein NQ127_03340 [Candidatus Cardinium sp.]|nr:hypothetical protein [Candidatus Cardinium sp.]